MTFILERRHLRASSACVFLSFFALSIPVFSAQGALETSTRQNLDDIHWCAEALQIPALRVVSLRSAAPDLDVTEENGLLLTNANDLEDEERTALAARATAGLERLAGVCVVQETFQIPSDVRASFPTTRWVVRRR